MTPSSLVKDQPFPQTEKSRVWAQLSCPDVIRDERRATSTDHGHSCGWAPSLRPGGTRCPVNIYMGFCVCDGNLRRLIQRRAAPVSGSELPFLQPHSECFQGHCSCHTLYLHSETTDFICFLKLQVLGAKSSVIPNVGRDLGGKVVFCHLGASHTPQSGLGDQDSTFKDSVGTLSELAEGGILPSRREAQSHSQEGPAEVWPSECLQRQRAATETPPAGAEAKVTSQALSEQRLLEKQDT